ncbi:MAG: type II secretion protein [Dissulfurispiraceae bacterium]|jgi:uncharacterized membrane protein YidH (DUF202 family)
MIISSDVETARFSILVDEGILDKEDLERAIASADARAVDLETVLIREYGVPRYRVIEVSADYYKCLFVEYDERMPIPPDLLAGLDSDRLFLSNWFPIARSDDTVIIAANNPSDPELPAEVRRFFRTEKYEFLYALREDIRWFIKDFLHGKPGYLVGTERTGLAHWRNNMAHWRTRLACYRNDLAKGRTHLAVLRSGLGIIAVADVLLHTLKFGGNSYIYWGMIGVGLAIGAFGLSGYLKIRRSSIRLPENQTLVEVTSATLYFLENYHFIEDTGVHVPTKGTMLARLGDFLASHCTILYPKPASKERTQLARERNVLAGQRTVTSCYRSIYARARTGLALMRTGISFSSLGIVLMGYFKFSFLAVIDILLLVAGVLMVVDGVLWYLPVRKEQSEIPRCPVPE